MLLLLNDVELEFWDEKIDGAMERQQSGINLVSLASIGF
jgi:hypothetical protein